MESVRAFYRGNCITRKHHGLPPQPFLFFKKIFDHMISKGHGLLVLATYAKRVIAGAVYFHFGEEAIFKFGASDRKYHQLRPNNLVMWEAINWYASNGFKGFSFGRTEPGNKGLLQFKRGWGTNEKMIKYYECNFKKGPFISEHSKERGFYNSMLNITPIPLLKLVGSVLYKHVG